MGSRSFDWSPQAYGLSNENIDDGVLNFSIRSKLKLSMQK